MPVEIINSTPWDTEDLTKFFLPLINGTGIDTVKVVLLLAQPGAKREDQGLYEVSTSLYDLAQGKLPSHINIQIISPRRAAARTDLLDRMAQVDNLAIHEIALPGPIAAGISHALIKLTHVCRQKTVYAIKKAIGDQWEFRKHLGGERYQVCECSKTLKVYPVIRGNTKTRTTPPVDINQLKRRGRWALEAAESYRGKMEKQLALAESLGKRIRKLEGKGR